MDVEEKELFAAITKSSKKAPRIASTIRQFLLDEGEATPSSV